MDGNDSSYLPPSRPIDPPGPDSCDLDHLADEIAVLSGQIQAATYRLLVLICEFDERGGWDCGFRSCAHWLAWRTGLDLGAAREKVRVARALETLPALSAAMRRGELSYSKARALTRIATPETEEELLAMAQAGTASQVERLVRCYRRVVAGTSEENALDPAAAGSLEEAMDRRRYASRYLTTRYDEDGMLVVKGRLEPEAGAALLKALEAAGGQLWDEAREKGCDDEEVLAEQRRAGAMGLMAESALAAGPRCGHPGRPLPDRRPRWARGAQRRG